MEHEAGTRRMRLPGGQRAGLHADRRKASRSFSGALPPTGNKVEPYPVEGNQNTGQTIPALEQLHRGTGTDRAAVVPGNARFHHARALTDLYEPGQPLERITPCSPAAVRARPQPLPGTSGGAAKNNTANIQRVTPRLDLQRVRPMHHRPRPRPRPRTPHPAKPKTTLLHDSHRSYAHSTYS